MKPIAPLGHETPKEGFVFDDPKQQEAWIHDHSAIEEINRRERIDTLLVQSPENRLRRYEIRRARMLAMAAMAATLALGIIYYLLTK